MQEFTDFLAKQPPFNALSTVDLERVSSQIEVEFFAAETIIVAARSQALRHIYIVRTGSVEVLDRGNVIDQLGPGDVFGHISVLTGMPPQYSVRAVEETLCYRVPDPRNLISDPSLLDFNHFGTLITRHRLTASALMSDMQSSITRFLRPIVWGSATDSVREIAMAMTAAEQSCAVIRAGSDLGLVTDRDFRSKVVGGMIGVDSQVHLIMSSPIITVRSDITLATAFLTMVEHGFHHLVVVDEFENPIGVVRAMDLSSVELRNPLLIRAAIESAKNMDELAAAATLLMPSLVELHDNAIPSLHVGSLMSAIVSSILARILALTSSISEPVDHSWLILGSIARGEGLPASDVDTAIVWADQPGEKDPAEEIRNNAKHILDLMERCGLQRCSNGANADNGLFSRSRSSWIEVSSAWLADPTRPGALLLSAIAADNQPITQITLGRTILENLRTTARSHEFLADALRFALAKKPPIGFVKDFVVDHSGKNRGGLDLKQGGLTPISSLARWAAIAMGDVRGGTVERLKRAAEANIFLTEESEILINAFRDIHQLVFEAEIAGIRSGSPLNPWIAPEALDSLTRRHLRESFRSISAIQNRIEGDWTMRL
ncbi:MAG: putative nucleotidyltransferase substrate binding domain-containing protein [Actinomycetes bacterium]